MKKIKKDKPKWYREYCRKYGDTPIETVMRHMLDAGKYKMTPTEDGGLEVDFSFKYQSEPLTLAIK